MSTAQVCFVYFFLTEMFVTMTPHSWQQTGNYITWKFCENVPIKVLLQSYSNGQKLAKSRIFDKIFEESRILMNEKWHFWRQNLLERNYGFIIIIIIMMVIIIIIIIIMIFVHMIADIPRNLTLLTSATTLYTEGLSGWIACHKRRSTVGEPHLT